MREKGEEERTLWLVRHAESTWNALGLVQGQADDATLTRQGRFQAEELAARFRGRSVDAVYASDLRRARETATPLASAVGLPVRTRMELRERCFGICEGQPQSTLGPDITGINGLEVVDEHAHPEYGESLNDVYKRAVMFIEWLTLQDHADDVVAVAHGGTVRAIRAYCAGHSVRDMGWGEVPNGSVWPVKLPCLLSTTT